MFFYLCHSFLEKIRACLLLSYDICFFFSFVLIYRVWESLSTVTCCISLVIVHGNDCLLQIGVAAESSTNGVDAVLVDPTQLIQGSLCQGVAKSGTRKCCTLFLKLYHLC